MHAARNILLFTLIVDYADGSKDDLIWNIYYHVFLETESLRLLQIQAEKLNSLSASIESWHNSNYGKILRMCDRGTLRKISRIWNSYDSSNLSEGEKAAYKKRLESEFQRVRDRKALHIGQGLNMTGVRSGAPIVGPLFLDMPQLFDHFWTHGVTDNDPDNPSKSRFPNPMFAGSTDGFTVHYGTDPLLGFHLATAYASLVSKLPLQSPENSRLHKAVVAARLQFREWSGSFRKKSQKHLTIRFFTGDALAFCHTLQHKLTTGCSSESNWYRDQYHMEPLVLDGEDYASQGDAPLLFNVIDTSNLLDHVGTINLLVAASPLLQNSMSATLYTEVLVKQEEDMKKLVDSILCGHFPTLSILLGLMPIEYWTNSTAIPTVSDRLFDKSLRRMGKNESSMTGQMYSRLTWKRLAEESTAMPILHFRGPELASILYQSYLQIFKNEDMTQIFSKMDLQTIQNNSLLHYHRGILASFLCYVKKRVKVDWNETMNVLISLVEKNSTLMVGSNYFQEFYVQLHLLGVHSVDTLSPSFNRTGHLQSLKGVGKWKDIPSVICITLKIPRAKLGVITNVPLKDLGTPILQCILQSSDNYPGRKWQNIFAAIQLAFGEITTSGSRHDDDFKVSISEDMLGWKGRSSLIVSFMVPLWVVLLEPHGATVALGVQTTPHSTRTFLKRLGLEMNIFKTALKNEDNVYMTKYRPNHAGHASVCNFDNRYTASSEAANEKFYSTMKANVDLQTGAIKTLTGRVDIISEAIRSSLRGGATVETYETNPWTIGVAIGDEKPLLDLLFPVPILRSRSKFRIARKSSYIEVEAPMADHRDGNGIPTFMYPTFCNKGSPVTWNMPQLNLDRLPILDTSKKSELGWLHTHTSLMFSSREGHLRNKVMNSSTETQKDARINFKDSLFTLYMRSCGLQGRKIRLFGINNPDGGGFHILIFVSCVRLDLANHTVVLDAAILPLHTSLVPRIQPFLQPLGAVGMCSVTADSDELRLWKEILPAWVERCRHWEHRPSCEYRGNSQIPLSTEFGHNPICSCGEGTLPSSIAFDLPSWHLAAKHAVRAAISPSFSVEFAERGVEGVRVGDEERKVGADALRCEFARRRVRGGRGF